MQLTYKENSSSDAKFNIHSFKDLTQIIIHIMAITNLDMLQSS